MTPLAQHQIFRFWRVRTRFKLHLKGEIKITRFSLTHILFANLAEISAH